MRIFIPINQPETVAGNGIVLIFFGEIMILCLRRKRVHMRARAHTHTPVA